MGPMPCYANTNAFHRARPKIPHDSTWHVTSSHGYVVIHVDAFKLQIGISMMGSGGIEAVLAALLMTTGTRPQPVGGGGGGGGGAAWLRMSL